MSSINDGLYSIAVERGIGQVIAQFERLPDAFLREVELHAALFRALQQQEILAESYLTDDGRRTGLVHRRYPPFAKREAEGHPPRSHDIVLLNPRFARSYPLDIVANRGDSRDARSCVSTPYGLKRADCPVPLLAAVRLCLVHDLVADTLDDLEKELGILEDTQEAEWAKRCYMGIFCRHWDLEEHLHRALPALEHLAAAHDDLSLVVVQSYYDDAGRVFGGRYLNLWTHMAALPPLDARRVDCQSARSFAQ